MKLQNKNKKSFIPQESMAKIESITHKELLGSIKEEIKCSLSSWCICASEYINLGIRLKDTFSL